MKKFFFVFLSFCFCLYSSDFTYQLKWIEKKATVTKKVNKEEFNFLRPFLTDLLKNNIYKEDVFAILNYLSREHIKFDEQLTIFKELSYLTKFRNIPSKELRNFISKKIKIAKINGKQDKELVSFLIKEIRNLNLKDKYNKKIHSQP